MENQTPHTKESLLALSGNKLKKAAEKFGLKRHLFQKDGTLIEEILKLQDEQNEGSNSGSGSSSSVETVIKKETETVVYGLKPASKGVVVIGVGFVTREKALKDQDLLASLKKLGHRAVIIIK